MSRFSRLCSMAAGLALGGALLLGAIDAEAARKLPPGYDGRNTCIANVEDDEQIWVDDARHRCCYEDDGLVMCVQCDENWQNCWEAPGSPKLTGGSSEGSPGTVSEPRGNSNPRIHLPGRQGTIRR